MFTIILEEIVCGPHNQGSETNISRYNSQFKNVSIGDIECNFLCSGRYGKYATNASLNTLSGSWSYKSTRLKLNTQSLVNPFDTKNFYSDGAKIHCCV